MKRELRDHVARKSTEMRIRRGRKTAHVAARSYHDVCRFADHLYTGVAFQSYMSGMYSHSLFLADLRQDEDGWEDEEGGEDASHVRLPRLADTGGGADRIPQFTIQG